jgi:hypothetical protein
VLRMSGESKNAGRRRKPPGLDDAQVNEHANIQLDRPDEHAVNSRTGR